MRKKGRERGLHCWLKRRASEKAEGVVGALAMVNNGARPP
jgi:hypothetical protein